VEVKTIDITEEAMAALRRAAVHEFVHHSVKMPGPGGMWRVPLSEDTYDRLMEKVLPGETVSDAIIRVVAVSMSAGLN